MELIFVGVGGTRRVMARQYEGVYTGGFRIHCKLKIHVDPGPGAITRSSQVGIKVEDTDVLVITHNHLDHASDANAIAEAMNGFGFKKRGTLLCSRAVVESEGCNNILIPYTANFFKEKHILKAGDKLRLNVEDEEVNFTATRIEHSENTGWGFILEAEGRKIGYTSDTRWFEGLGKQFEGVDALIANITHIRGGKTHLSMEENLDALLEESRPKNLFIYHIGEDFIHYDKEELMELLESYENRHGTRVKLPTSGERFKV